MLLLGATQTLETVRVGFPNSRIVVLYNGPHEESGGAVATAASAAGCEYMRLSPTLSHAAILAEIVTHAGSAPTVFLDGDLIFWEKCEDWTFDTPAAGRLIPRFLDEYTGAITEPRLHTSFLWLSNPAEYVGVVSKKMPLMAHETSPWNAITIRDGDRWRRWDTLAQAYAIAPEAHSPFTSAHLDAYDHLFCGTHWPLVAPRLYPESSRRLRHAQEVAATNPPALRGLWREQDAHFAARAV